jgi:hypothetical protein
MPHQLAVILQTIFRGNARIPRSAFKTQIAMKDVAQGQNQMMPQVWTTEVVHIANDEKIGAIFASGD